MSSNHSIPRPEYPRPQFVRSEWINLNGQWDFAFDNENKGVAEQWFSASDGNAFDREITVPYAPQSKLSGIGTREVPDTVWYRRSFDVPDSYEGKRVILHFGAVDYISDVWVNGVYIGRHEGGHTPFAYDITEAANAGESNTVVVRAEDNTTDLELPRGKQHWKSYSEGIFYTPTIGIWQTVWLEAISPAHISHFTMTPDLDRATLDVDIELSDAAQDALVQVEISYQGHTFISDRFSPETYNGRSVITRTFPIRYGGNGIGKSATWSPEHPNLYDIEFKVIDAEGTTLDEVSSYFGMRKIHVEDGRVFLNNHPYMMRLVLDQGYWPDGLLTAPTDEDLRKDIELSKEMGFNGARKHQKVEDPRFMYWADRLGYLIWGEMANAYHYSSKYVHRFVNEWKEVIKRDYNHPSIVCWVPLNESWGVDNMRTDMRHRDHATSMYYLTRSLDATRLVISNDGWEHTISDLFTIHDYDQDPESFEEKWHGLTEGLRRHRPAGKQLAFDDNMTGRPVHISEYGGIAFKVSAWEGWGYGGVNSEEELLARYAALTNVLHRSPNIDGFCYTQLTDVEQEINGLLTYDRKPKASLRRLRSITQGHGDPGPDKDD